MALKNSAAVGYYFSFVSLKLPVMFTCKKGNIAVMDGTKNKL